MKEYKLSDILLKYVDFLADPSPKMETEINTILSDIVIREYLPLEDKLKLMVAIINQAQIIDETAVMMSMNIEIGKIVMGLIGGYCINVTNDLNLTSLQLSVYDLLYECGFVDYVLDKGAKKDFERFIKMIDNALNFTNLFSLLDAFTNIDPENIEEFNATIDKFKNSLTTENIEALKVIVGQGTPAVQHIENAITDTILNETLGKERPVEFEKDLISLAADIQKIQQKNLNDTNEN